MTYSRKLSLITDEFETKAIRPLDKGMSKQLFLVYR